MGVLTSAMGIGKQIGAMRDKKKKSSEKRVGEGLDSSPSSPTGFDSYKRGGKVKRTGLAMLHKDEQVLPKGRARKYRSKKR